MQSRHQSVVISRPVQEVYAFAADPDNLPRWAAGLVGSAVVREGDSLLVDSPMGQVGVTFVPHNALGVLDHEVVTPDGARTLNPVRVVAHPDGSEVVFTVRQLALSADELASDAAQVQADLERLRALLEG